MKIMNAHLSTNVSKIDSWIFTFFKKNFMKFKKYVDKISIGKLNVITEIKMLKCLVFDHHMSNNSLYGN